MVTNLLYQSFSGIDIFKQTDTLYTLQLSTIYIYFDIHTIVDLSSITVEIEVPVDHRYKHMFFKKIFLFQNLVY